MDLINELEKRTDAFNEYWQRYLKEDKPTVLYDAARHLPLSGGKKLRPCLAILSCESVFGDIQKVMPFAVALELMHNFTLIHDDMMDKSNLRRNVPAVHIKYGEPVALLAGDLLFAKSFEAMHGLSVDLHVFKELNYCLVECTIDICKGQQLDIEFEQRKMVTENQYIKMIAKKTAALFKLAAGGGAAIGGGGQDEINALSDYGLFLGLSFQIWDDYLDVSSDEETLGKDIGNDIRNGKKTLIAVHSLQNATGENKQILDEVFGNRDASDDDVKRVSSLFDEIGSIDYAKNTALNYNKNANDALDVLRDSHAKEILKELVNYSTKRER